MTLVAVLVVAAVASAGAGGVPIPEAFVPGNCGVMTVAGYLQDEDGRKVGTELAPRSFVRIVSAKGRMVEVDPIPSLLQGCAENVDAPGARLRGWLPVAHLHPYVLADPAGAVAQGRTGLYRVLPGTATDGSKSVEVLGHRFSSRELCLDVAFQPRVFIGAPPTNKVALVCGWGTPGTYVVVMVVSSDGRTLGRRIPQGAQTVTDVHIAATLWTLISRPPAPPPPRTKTYSFFSLGPIGSLTSRDGRWRRGLGGELSFGVLRDELTGWAPQLIGVLTQAESIEGERARLALAAEIAYAYLGLELGFSYEAASERASESGAVHVAPFIAAGFGYIAGRFALPLDRSAGKPGVETGIVLGLKIPWAPGLYRWF